MKRMIFQVAVGDVPDFYQPCISSVERYCKKYDIKHIVLREPELKIKPLNSHRSENALRLNFLPIYEKEVAFKYLDDYDQIAIVDGDIYIRENTPNIFDELDDGTVFAGVLEQDMPLTPEYIRKIKAYSAGQYARIADKTWRQSPTFGYEFYNMGLMLFSNKIKDYLNGEAPEQFIRRPEFERFVNGEGNWKWSTDQTLLNYWVRKSGMKLKNLNWKWNALFKGVRDDVLPQAYFLHFFLSGNLPRKGEEIPEIVENLDKASSIKGHG